MKRMLRNRYIIVGIVLLALVAAGAYLSKEQPSQVLTLEDLPENVVEVRHEHEIQAAEKIGKIPMDHFATPEAIENGGPIFGTDGYQIVAIEYQLAPDEIPDSSVGEVFSGYLLNIPELQGVPVDHFHISKIPVEDDHGDHSHEGEYEYSTHFMLITHAEEESRGLYCE